MSTFNKERSLVVDFGKGGHEFDIFEDQRKGQQGWE